VNKIFHAITGPSLPILRFTPPLTAPILARRDRDRLRHGPSLHYTRPQLLTVSTRVRYLDVLPRPHARAPLHQHLRRRPSYVIFPAICVVWATTKLSRKCLRQGLHADVRLDEAGGAVAAGGARVANGDIRPLSRWIGQTQGRMWRVDRDDARMARYEGFTSCASSLLRLPLACSTLFSPITPSSAGSMCIFLTYPLYA